MTIWKRDLDLIISNYSAKGHKEALPLLYRQLTWKLISPPPQSLGKLLLFLVSWQPQSYNRPTSVFFLTVGTAVSNIYTKRSKSTVLVTSAFLHSFYSLFSTETRIQWQLNLQDLQDLTRKNLERESNGRVKYCILSEALIHSNPSTA